MAFRTVKDKNGNNLYDYDDEFRYQNQPVPQQATQQKQQQGGLGGLLGSIMGGIGDTIGSIGKGIYGVIGTGVASARDLGSQITGQGTGNVTYTKQMLEDAFKKAGNNQDWYNQYKPVLDQLGDRDKISGVWLEDENGKPQFVESKEGKETTAFKRSVWGDKNDTKIDYNKIGWDSVKSAADVASVASPLATGGMGTGARIATDLALDTGLGAVQGAAQSGAQGGSGEDIAKGALTGGISGLATSGLNNALNVKLAGGNHKILNSSIGRGALSGAVGGAVGGGTSAALYGQDVGQAALSGAGQGLVQGAGSGAVMGGINKLGNALYDSRMDKLSQSDNGFGKRYNTMEGNPDQAIDYLIKRKGGEVEGAIKSPAVEAITGDGDVDLVYGKGGSDGYGLAHIVEKHGLGVAKKIPDILQNGEAYRPDGVSDRLYVQKTGDNSVVRLDWDGNKKQWVATAFEQTNPASKGARLTNASNVGSSPDNVTSDTSITSNVPQNTSDVNSPYGESALANSTSKQNLRNRVKKVGQYLEGSQVSPTRAEVREILGNKSAGEAIDAVRRKTGISDIDMQAQFADEITGRNGMMDSIQKDILTYGEDGKPITVRVSDISDDIDSIVNKHIKNATKGANRDKMIAEFKSDLSNPETSAIDLANSYREQARELRTKGSINPSGAEKAQARVYDEIAGKIEDSFYNKLSNEQVDALFDASINEARNRANVAKANNNKKVATAYNKVADDLSKLPRTVKAFRGYKKDYVDINRLYGKNSAANQVGSRSNIATGVVAGAMSKNPLAGAAASVLTRVLPEPVNDAMGWIGGKVVDFADKNPSSNLTAVNNKGLKNTNITTRDGLLDVLGRTQGIKEGEEVKNQAQQAANLESQLGNAAYATDNTGYVGVPNSGVSVDMNGNVVYGTNGYSNNSNNMLDRLVVGMENALNAGDISAFSQLADIYNTLSKVYGTTGSSSSNSQQKLSATQQRANAAMNSLNRLEGMNPDLGYNLSGIPIIGGIATLGGNAYEGEAKSLAQQIGYMVSGSNIKAEEAEAIGKAYVPQPFDSEYTRQLKLQRAAEIIQQYQNGTTEDTTTANNYSY